MRYTAMLLSRLDDALGQHGSVQVGDDVFVRRPLGQTIHAEFPQAACAAVYIGFRADGQGRTPDGFPPSGPGDLVELHAEDHTSYWRRLDHGWTEITDQVKPRKLGVAA